MMTNSANETQEAHAAVGRTQVALKISFILLIACCMRFQGCAYHCTTAQISVGSFTIAEKAIRPLLKAPQGLLAAECQDEHASNSRLWCGNLIPLEGEQIAVFSAAI